MDYNLQKNQNAEQTYHSIRNSIVSAQHRLSTAVNSAMVTTYWEIGEQIFKACGENDRAEYGKKLLEYLSEQLTAEFGKGFDKSNLRKMRQFYCTFPIRDTLCPELSWSHYRVLMRINDEQARRFYMEECAKAAWSVRQLERQINTMYYRRILASQDKIAVANEIQTTEPKPEFPFGTWKRIFICSTPEKVYIGWTGLFIDLVFYNYILKCFVLIDLKMGKLTHQDLGQMQMYVNYYTREMMNEGDTQPIGIVLCADKGDSIVKYTLPEDNHQIFASKYFTYLPSEEELKRELNLKEFHKKE